MCITPWLTKTMRPVMRMMRRMNDDTSMQQCKKHAVATVISARCSYANMHTKKRRRSCFDSSDSS